MRTPHIFIYSLLLISGLTACHKEDIGLTDDSILQTNKDDILSYANSKGLSGTLTPTGVYYALNKAGNSTVTPSNGQEAEFNYTLSVVLHGTNNVLTDKLVDSTFATRSSYAYLVATNPGLTEGLLRMHEGDKSVILLPSVYAFGTAGSTDGAIPPNSPVRLDVSLKRVRTEDQQIDEYLTANKMTPSEVTTSGLRFIRTLASSTGSTPTAGQTLTVKYRGQLLRSLTAFDSTGVGTYSTVIGQSVPGFDEGLSKLKVGEKATIIFPSKIGYGSAGRGAIPPYAPMRFDIELVSAL